MSMLTYLPWCPLEGPISVANLKLLPFAPDTQPAGIDTPTWSTICKILSVYRDINGNPVNRAALVQLDGKHLTDELCDSDLGLVSDLIALACCCSLGHREYFRGNLRYCNTDCFVAFTQKFDNADYTVIVTRRRDIRSDSAWSLDKVHVSIPVHCHTVKRIEFDQPFLDALVAHRESASAEEWGRWQNTIAQFNMASTDSENMREQVEWVLLAGVFEHLLEASSNAKDVARCFETSFVPSTAIPAATSPRATEKRFSNGVNDKSLRYAWMEEFYRVRGDFAHGKLVTRRPMAWNVYEHLFLATLAFPLLLKSLLSNAGRYALTSHDRQQIDCFETLASTLGFLHEPRDPANSRDSHWGRLKTAWVDPRRVEELRKCLEQAGVED